MIFYHISLILISGQCTNGFPIASRRQNTEQMIISAVTTYLFPSLTFGCNGTIVRLTVTVTDSNGLQGPKVQIWREKKGLHYKLSPEILISDLSCEDLRLSEGRFQCTLNEAARVSVQPGDILGLNIPPDENRDGYGILFTTSTESNAYIFQHQLSSTVNLTEANVAITSYLPRITPLVILGNYILFVLCIQMYQFHH